MSQMQNLPEVKSNVELICEDVNIFGDVYSHSMIDAHKLFVKGITHPDTMQFSKYAEIHEHQGVLRCHKAKITTLNGGEVHASNIEIENCLHGSIYAQDVKINNISNNLTIYASHSISINSINGSNNNFYIDYREIPILVSKLELIQEDLEELEVLLEAAEESNSLTQRDIENEIKRLKIESVGIQKSATSATVSISKDINGENLISFAIDDSNSITYKTQDTQYSPFYLKFQDNTVTLHPTQTTTIL